MTSLEDGRSADASGRRAGLETPERVAVDRVAQGRQASLALRRERARLRRDALLPIIAELRAAGATSYQAIADGLNTCGIPAPRGVGWKRSQARHVLKPPE